MIEVINWLWGTELISEESSSLQLSFFFSDGFCLFTLCWFIEDAFLLPWASSSSEVLLVSPLNPPLFLRVIFSSPGIVSLTAFFSFSSKQRQNKQT